jgi:formylmethanofuran dehydrogenase subunit E
MNKYINANELKLILNREHLNYSQMIEKKFVLNAIDNMPSADVVEVKHGEWKEEPSIFPNNPFVRCSECGEEALLDENGVAKSNFCPNCGADMRGETDDRPPKTND